MSRKDYELIATVIRSLEPTDRPYLAERFAEALAGTNERFDHSRFLAACVGEAATDSAGRRVRYSNA